MPGNSKKMRRIAEKERGERSVRERVDGESGLETR